MDKNTENAIVNAIGELGVKMDHMNENLNLVGTTVVDRLDSISDKLDTAIDLNKRVGKLEKAVFGK